MRVGLVRTGIIVSEGDSNVYSNTLLLIGKILIEAGVEVVIYTDVDNSFHRSETFTWRSLFDSTADIDVLLIVNGFLALPGTLNLPPSIISPITSQRQSFVLINKFAGPVFYALCDPEEILKDYPAYNCHIMRRDITVLSQPFNLSQLETRWRRVSKVEAKFKHFPFERFPLLQNHQSINVNPIVDVSYGGQPRFGKRSKRLTEWYFSLSDDVRVEIFGSIAKSNLNNVPKNVSLSDYVPFSRVLTKMNESVSHLVISDVEYEILDLVSQRTFEGIAAKTVIFIDSRMDKSRRVFPIGTSMNEFSYVSSVQEFESKLRQVKNDELARRQILAEQFSQINFDKKEYCQNLVQLLKGNE